MNENCLALHDLLRWFTHPTYTESTAIHASQLCAAAGSSLSTLDRASTSSSRITLLFIHYKIEIQRKWLSWLDPANVSCRLRWVPHRLEKLVHASVRPFGIKTAKQNNCEFQDITFTSGFVTQETAGTVQFTSRNCTVRYADRSAHPFS